jgi:hypothetical protein
MTLPWILSKMLNGDVVSAAGGNVNIQATTYVSNNGE